ncbi:2707_t:CDS:1, partial [Acaulospora morrowiae]
MAESKEIDTESFSKTIEEISLRHKKELKELNCQITSLRKTVTKGDKKRKKEVQNEIKKLEEDLR